MADNSLKIGGCPASSIWMALIFRKMGNTP